MSSYQSLRMQFNQKPFAFKRDFADFRPRKRVQPRNALEHGDSHVRNGQIQWQSLKVLGMMHFHAVQFAATRSLQQIEVSFAG